MMGKRTSAAKKLNKEPKGNGSSVGQQILATLKEIKKKLDESRPPSQTNCWEISSMQSWRS